MLMIQKLKGEMDSALAVVSDGIKEYQVVCLPGNWSVCEKGRKDPVEQYKCLQETVYSRFAEIFLTLQRTMNTCSKAFSAGILQEITGKKQLSTQGDRLTCSNLFTYRGEEMIACAERNYSSEIPEYTYSVSGTDLSDMETYSALYQAVDSEFYPILADLDNDLENMEGKENT